MLLHFDEPLSNLDAKWRGQMRLEIRRLQRRLNITSVYVTHDQAEAMAMSDRIVVMNGARIEQAAAPEIIYRRPTSVFVADFIGRANFIEVSALSPAGHGRAVIEAFDERLEVPSHPDALEADDQVLLVRPESLRPQQIQTGRNGLSGRIGRVLATVFYGDYVEYEVEIEAGENLLVSESDPDVDAILTEGSFVRIDFGVERSWLLPNS